MLKIVLTCLLSLCALSTAAEGGTVAFSFDGTQEQMRGQYFFGTSLGTDAADPARKLEGKFGSALAFDGQDDMLVIPDLPSLHFGADDSFTVELWVKPLTEDLSAKTPILAQGDRQSAFRWKFLLYNKGRLGFFVENRQQQTLVNFLSGKNSLGDWHHLAFVRDRQEKQLRFYLDAILIREEEDTLPPDAFDFISPLFVGKASATEPAFQGLVDEITFTRSVKRRFDLAVPPRDDTSGDAGAYQRVKAVAETPEAGVQASWNEIERLGLNLVPAPKQFAASGEPVALDQNWRVILRHAAAVPGLEELDRQMTSQGLPPLPRADEAGEGSCIIAGTFAELAAVLPRIGNPEQPKRQGYIIDSYEDGGKTVVLVIGSDTDGVRYGLVTLSQLLLPGGKLVRAKIADWPDYKWRMGFTLHSYEPAAAKAVLDEVFHAKLNMVWGQGFYQRFEDMLKNAEARREITAYAAARGIRIVIGNWFDVAAAPYPADMQGYSKHCYPYKTEEGMMGHRGRAFTWSNDEYLQNQANNIRQFMRETGTDTFFFHVMDCGGRDNPENWKNRTAMDRERWGDDRASADAHLILNHYNAMKAENPEAMLFAVAYPYGAKYLAFPEVRAWMEKLTSLLPEDIFLCIRENNREGMEIWKNSNRQGRHIYHEAHPWSLRPAYCPGGRYARTFFFDDRDIYWYQLDAGPCGVTVWTAAEYAWNTKAPGWAWMPEPSEARRIPVAEAMPPAIREQLLPRICGKLFGAAAAADMATAFAACLPSMLAADLSAFTDPDPDKYFAAKAEDAEKAVAALDAAAPQVPPAMQAMFKQANSFLRNCRSLIAARHQYFLSRDSLAKADLPAAEEAVRQGLAQLEQIGAGDAQFAKYKRDILKDLDIATALKWRRERDDYLKTVTPKPMRIGLYATGFSRGVAESLSGVPGVKVISIADPTRAELANCDVLMFCAPNEMGDTFEDWRQNVKAFVENGGGVIFTHNSVGRAASSAFGTPLFPEICAGYGGQAVGKKTLTAAVAHPALGTLQPDNTLEHIYTDHLWAKPGATGEVLLRDVDGHTVMVAGTVGKGRVIYTGQIFGINEKDELRESTGEEWKLLYNLLRWSAGEE
jgi:hypothetical protein